jgi:hypothetical protein
LILRHKTLHRLRRQRRRHRQVLPDFLLKKLLQQIHYLVENLNYLRLRQTFENLTVQPRPNRQ